MNIDYLLDNINKYETKLNEKIEKEYQEKEQKKLKNLAELETNFRDSLNGVFDLPLKTIISREKNKEETSFWINGYLAFDNSKLDELEKLQIKIYEDKNNNCNISFVIEGNYETKSSGTLFNISYKDYSGKCSFSQSVKDKKVKSNIKIFKSALLEVKERVEEKEQIESDRATFFPKKPSHLGNDSNYAETFTPQFDLNDEFDPVATFYD